MTDTKILELALSEMAKSFERFIASCTDESGNPKITTKSEIMKARACLPKHMDLALKKVKS